MPVVPIARATRIRRGMTLLEVMIVVILLGILASIAYPIVNPSLGESTQTAFYSSLRQLVKASALYYVKTGEYPQSNGPGQEPAGMSDVSMQLNCWSNETPVGGAWTARRNVGGIKAAVGVEFGAGDSVDSSLLSRVDSRFDDGSLATGRLRQLGPGYYYVLAE
ncbi:MAG: prepilin-type N-terminal cleavage/methylation domain-containing protein [Planctomycetes bacterium]|nr:prepilin-type N-terminal cleavage/methylation domain-containing protein [Phycisphaerae bacterium]NBB95756.1 prepilin-type N-terminal cleavage/methylation domain-containing protein [Planctomycetota bacterium]